MLSLLDERATGPQAELEKTYLLDQLPSLEEASQIGNLPHGQRAQTHHGGDAEQQHAVVGRGCWERGNGGKLLRAEPFKCQLLALPHAC